MDIWRAPVIAKFLWARYEARSVNPPPNLTKSTYSGRHWSVERPHERGKGENDERPRKHEYLVDRARGEVSQTITKSNDACAAWYM